MYQPREKVFWFAVISHIAILILQCFFNALCPDHNADAFRTPIDPDEKVSVLDEILSFFLSGLTRWDAQYFIHITKYGYTYENTLAFFPLLPMLMRVAAGMLKHVLFLFSYTSIVVIVGIVINFICFVKSSVILYDLTNVIFKDTRIAYRAAIFFCINPARIFFASIYTEALFAYMTFHCMLASFVGNPCVFLSLSLSTLVRSNGLVNLGFALFAWFKDFLVNTLPNFMREQKYYHENKRIILFNLRHIFISLSQIFMTLTLSIVPYYLLQVYNYTKFCTQGMANSSIYPEHIKQHALDYNFLLPGYRNFSWCESSIPTSYAYVQNTYWNVGFLKYYKVKQIPNFLLALPVLYFTIEGICDYFREHKSKLFTLEFFTCESRKEKNIVKYPIEMFVFVIHGAFLTAVCVFFLHIQISTRFLCSASPLLYWFCAIQTLTRCKKDVLYEKEENTYSKWKVFFITQKDYNLREKVIYAYFLGYIVVGCFMHSNFLPWT